MFTLNESKPKMKREKPQICCLTKDLLRDQSTKLRLEREMKHSDDLHHCLPKFAWPPKFDKSKEECSYPYITISDEQTDGFKVCQYATLVILRELFNVKVGVSRKTNDLISKVFADPLLNVGHQACVSEDISVNFNHLYYFLNTLSSDSHKVNKTHIPYPFSRNIALESGFCPYELIGRNRILLQEKMKFKESDTLMNPVIDYFRIIMHKGTRTIQRNVSVIPAKHRDFVEYYKILGSIYEGIMPSPAIYYKNIFTNPELKDTYFLALCEDAYWCIHRLFTTKPKHFVMALPVEEILDLYIYHWADYIILDRSPLAFMAAMLHNFKKIFVPLNGSNPEHLERDLMCVQMPNVITVPTTQEVVHEIN